mmetsp:Transcript_41418/g.123776  ORF Transcript_41418/g.123776 Transcript_41418/m.123776 type:complete len:216 (+) Transcript_41418:644-1291(+)
MGPEVVHHRVVLHARVGVDAVGPEPHARGCAQAPGEGEKLGNGLAAACEDPVKDCAAAQTSAGGDGLLHHHQHVVVDVPSVKHRAVGHGGQQACASEGRGVHGLPHVSEHEAVTRDIGVVDGLHDAVKLSGQLIIERRGLHPPVGDGVAEGPLVQLPHVLAPSDDVLTILRRHCHPSLSWGQIQVDLLAGRGVGARCCGDQREDSHVAQHGSSLL